LATVIALLPARSTADGTHRRLLEEALLRFGERGFHGVSVREIAEAAGIRASSIYAHLESKEELLFQLMYIGHEEHYEMLRHALLDAGADPFSQIRHVVAAHVRLHATYPLLARVCNRELPALSEANRDRVLTIRSNSEQLILDVINRGMSRGVFHVSDPWLGYAAIGSMGIRVAEWWDQRAYDIEDVAETYADFAVRLLSGAPAT